MTAWSNAGIGLARIIGRRDAARAAWKAAQRNDAENNLAREYQRGLPPSD